MNVKKIKTNVKTFHHDEEYRELIMEAYFQRMLSGIDSTMDFRDIKENPIRKMNLREYEKTKQMFMLGMLDGIEFGKSFSDEIVNRLVEAHIGSVELNVGFALKISEMIDVCEKNGTLFFGCDETSAFHNLIESQIKMHQEQLVKMREKINQ